jgi:hypothetical protein
LSVGSRPFPPCRHQLHAIAWLAGLAAWPSNLSNDASKNEIAVEERQGDGQRHGGRVVPGQTGAELLDPAGAWTALPSTRDKRFLDAVRDHGILPRLDH